MVQQLPRFQSDRTTSIPSMGIVQQTGDRALAQSLQGVGSAFDKIANFANRKADEQISREMIRQGQEVALEKGFDPSSLGNPLTMADTVFRESALSTYAIQLENDVSQNMNRLYSENLLNPNGFKQKAESYAQSVTQNLPQELKNGVSKMVFSDLNSKHAKLQINMQNRVIAETEKAEESNLSRLVEKLSLEYDPEKKQDIMNRIDVSLENSLTYLTPQAKQAKRNEVVRDIIYNDGYARVSRGETSPFELQQELESQGILLNSSELNQVYAASSLKANYEEKQYQIQDNAKSRFVSGKARNYLIDTYDLQESGVSEQEFNGFLEGAMQDMRQSGASVEEMKDLRASMLETYYATGRDSDQAMIVIDQMIFDGNKDGFEKIDDMFLKGLITQETRLKKISELTDATSDIFTDKRIKDHINYFVATEAPYANIAVDEIEFMASKGSRVSRNDVASQKVALQEFKRRINDMWSKGMSTTDINSALRNERIQKQAEKIPASEYILKLNPDSPVYSQASSILRNDSFSIQMPLESGQLLTQTIDDPWSQNNYQERLDMMRAANESALKSGRALIYSPELLKELFNAFE
jgi:hypothetical protein